MARTVTFTELRVVQFHSFDRSRSSNQYRSFGRKLIMAIIVVETKQLAVVEIIELAIVSYSFD